MHDAEREGACHGFHVNRPVDYILRCLYITKNRNHETSPLVHENAPHHFPGQDDPVYFSLRV